MARAGVAYVPTDEARRNVRMWAGLGSDQKKISTRLGIGLSTLLRYFENELKEGEFDAATQVQGKLFEACMQGHGWAICFYLKTRCGWREVQRLEHTGADGGPITIAAVDGPPKETYEQYIERRQQEQRAIAAPSLRLVAPNGTSNGGPSSDVV